MSIWEGKIMLANLGTDLGTAGYISRSTPGDEDEYGPC